MKRNKLHHPPPDNDVKTALTASPVDVAVEPLPSFASENPAQDLAKHKKILAEKYFDRGLYGSISYFGQAATSVLLTQWIQHGSGKEKFAVASKWLSENLLQKKFGRPADASDKLANTLLVATTLINVGNLFLFPVKYIENHKPEYVARINDWLNQKREAKGEVISEQERQEQQAAIAHIAQQPRQTWGSLLSARVFSLGAIYAAITAVGGNRNKMAEDFSAKTLSKTLETVGVISTRANSKPIQDFARIAFVDFAYSIVGAAALYAYCHIIAPPKKKTNSQEPAEALASDLLAPMVVENDATPAPKEAAWKSHLAKPEAAFADKTQQHPAANLGLGA